MKKPLVLIVDDRPENLEMIKQLLELSGLILDFLQAPNGEVACRLTEKHLPDLVLMDWEMPVMDGIEALAILKSKEVTKEIPVIMCTARTDTRDLEKALNAGAADYIKKPFDRLELVARVKASLSLSSFLKEIKEKSEKLEDLNREKDGLMSMVAHDLKSPLNKLKGFLYLMPMVGELNEEQKDFKNQMEGVIAEANNLIRDLLDMNSLSHASSELNVSTIPLASYLEEWLKGYQQDLLRKEQELHFSLSDKGVQFKTDKELLNRILDNLMTNAIKFTQKGKNIFFAGEVTDSNITFSIRDEGPGISEDDQRKMFKKFQRLSAQPTDGETSNGLGLAIIKSLVEKMNGTIEVSSELNVGTEFKITFPL